MSANLTDAIQEKLAKLAKAAPNLGKITIICDGEITEQVDAIVTFAQGLGIEVSVEPRESVAEALQKAAECYTVSFDIRDTKDALEEQLEKEINSKKFLIKPIVFEDPKHSRREEKAIHREHMKQMQRYQNRHWRK